MSQVRRRGDPGTAERRLPPVVSLGVLAFGLAIAGVSYLVSFLPREPNLVPAIALLAAAAACVVANAIALARVRDFAWRPFFTVLRWTFLVYAVLAGLLMFIFIYNELPGRQLAFLIATLLVVTVDIPMILAFSVARYQ